MNSFISNRPGNVFGYVDGRAASAASVVLMPCTSITMAPASTLMIHNASIEPQGSYNEPELAKALKLVRDTNEKLIGLYSARWKGGEQELRDALAAETYLTPAEAIERGLADYISSSVTVAAYQVVVGTCKATPGFELAACEDKHRQFVMRRARLKLWLIEADSIRYELQS